MGLHVDQRVCIIVVWISFTDQHNFVVWWVPLWILNYPLVGASLWTAGSICS